MQLPLEITYRDVEKTERLDSLIREHAGRLDRYNDHISSCRVAVEKPHRRQETSVGYRVRVDLTVPPRHELAVSKEAQPGDPDHRKLETIIDEAFDAAARRVKKLSEMQNGKVKTHASEQVQGFIEKLFEDHGFLRSPEHLENVYFHRNSVAGINFDALKEGMPVAFSEVMGDKGPQASTVRVPEEAVIKPPRR